MELLLGGQNEQKKLLHQKYEFWSFVTTKDKFVFDVLHVRCLSLRPLSPLPDELQNFLARFARNEYKSATFFSRFFRV